MNKNKIITLTILIFIVAVSLKSLIFKKKKNQNEPSIIAQNLSLCKVKNIDWNFSIDIDGEVFSSKDSELKSLVTSNVSKILIRKNSYVKKNQKLIILEDGGIAEECESNKSLLEIQEKNLKVVEEMYKNGIESKASYQNAIMNFSQIKSKSKQCNQRINSIEIKAPFSGYITDIYVKDGENVLASSTKLLRIVGDSSENYIVAYISKDFHNLIKIGDLATIIKENYKTSAIIKEFSSSGNSGYNTFGATIIPTKKSKQLNIGDFVKVSIPVKFKNSFALKYESLISDSENKISLMTIDKETGQVKNIPIKDYRKWKEFAIISGLDDDLIVVTDGHYLLNDYSLVDMSKYKIKDCYVD